MLCSGMARQLRIGKARLGQSRFGKAVVVGKGRIGLGVVC